MIGVDHTLMNWNEIWSNTLMTTLERPAGLLSPLVGTYTNKERHDDKRLYLQDSGPHSVLCVKWLTDMSGLTWKRYNALRTDVGIILKVKGKLLPPAWVGSLLNAALMRGLLKPNLNEWLNLSRSQAWEKTWPPSCTDLHYELTLIL